ncbi:hypothetical protein Kpol_1050p74 [Vanderwaltozyma polyspora DSM 70294]|uniref:Succinate--CoA ligase [ADP-forming] subunit beta, mitochondrial n=1 Tax=Vanderwaltozyma polyspora (strain ATCC 22028 / DSM 70294 / BCRC 21397 / CBS 2163 / NBRC 10782 / NRRL Y-8283 / UCD 57-17) TaxID=436907 RepID=A7TEW9_VANPO|nr:uncharacterized protein Kpol_1050p74 [Vanderwaltozyma polyspora DSM 70294]EDO19215.1 hypothetical protein Kpol_1050p74 [Vanderwaltozyma polyspora DSM 70294]
MLRSCIARRSVVTPVSKRFLSINEFRSAQLLNEYGVNTPAGAVAWTPQQASQVSASLFDKLGRDAQLVVKAQALTGGRGKGHFDNGFPTGIQMVDSQQQATETASQMLGHRLITKQSGEKGKLVNAVYIVERKKVLREAYLSILMDRAERKPLIIVCEEGGMNIEEVAERSPEKIKKFHIDPSKGVTDEIATGVAKGLGFSQEVLEDAKDQVKRLYKIYDNTDATQIEINPLSEVETAESKHGVMCMDAKFGFDDNASYRQERIYSWRNDVEESPEEKFSTEAKRDYDLNFVKLNGNIGCLVNGAGLAMATMDVIQLYGGKPANFLDCGGGATPQTIKKAFELIVDSSKTSATPLDAIFVNIFGGIVRCDFVAQGIVDAIKDLNLKDLPIVVRLQGTNLDEGREIVKSSGVNILAFDELDPAAEKVVEVANSRA